jgi:glycosyltransferase involved in cell wall biosynthesis
MNDPQPAPTGTRVPAQASQPLVVCTTLSHSPSWRWFERVFDKLRWDFYGARPRNVLERRITRPALASWRACWQAVQAARRNRAVLLISHDARITFRTALAARLGRLRIPHVAWGFNFTTLPRGRHRKLMASAFAHVDRFIVYSTLERSLYAEYFDLDPGRFDVVLWGVGEPLVDSAAAARVQGGYISALGGNARDYRTLFGAIERTREIPLVVVAPPAAIAGLKVPPNVQVQSNVPRDVANNILAYSRFTVLPLAGADVPCGHVTLVAAMYLKKAMIVTRSSGVADYVHEDVNGLLVPAGDVDALAALIRDLWNDPSRCERLGSGGRAFAQAHCSEAQMIEHLKRVLLAYGLPV